MLCDPHRGWEKPHLPLIWTLLALLIYQERILNSAVSLRAAQQAKTHQSRAPDTTFTSTVSLCFRNWSRDCCSDSFFSYMLDVWQEQCFWKRSLLLTKAAFIDHKYVKNCEILLIFKIAVFYVNICSNVIYFCDQSCIFSIITAVFSVTWSSEIILICWFAAQETFLIIINVENSHAAQYFCENCDTMYFLVFTDE